MKPQHDPRLMRLNEMSLVDRDAVLASAEILVGYWLMGLTKGEREVVKLRYGIWNDGYVYTQEEVGKIFRVSRERVRKVEASALHKLGVFKVAEVRTHWLQIVDLLTHPADERPIRD